MYFMNLLHFPHREKGRPLSAKVEKETCQFAKKIFLRDCDIKQHNGFSLPAQVMEWNGICSCFSCSSCPLLPSSSS